MQPVLKHNYIWIWDAQRMLSDLPVSQWSTLKEAAKVSSACSLICRFRNGPP